MYRELILDSAECVFGARGFDGATMQAIAREAGVSLKTVYSSFPGKREIYGEIIRLRSRAMNDAIEAARMGAKTPMEKIAAGSRAFVDFLFGHVDWMRIHCARRHAVGGEDAAGAGPFEPSEQGAAEECAPWLREGIEAGVFYGEDPDELAVIVQALTAAHVSHALKAGQTDAGDVADRLVARLERLLCKAEGARIREAG
jgi:AcrR family transcriptional regulator